MSDKNIISSTKRLDNINEDTNFRRTDVYKVDIAGSDIDEDGVHKFAEIEKGRAVVGMTAAVVSNIVATGGSTASKISVGILHGSEGASAEDIIKIAGGTACTASSGKVFCANANNVNGVIGSDGGYAVVNISGATFTSGGCMFVGIDTVPVDEYGKRG